MKKGFSAILHLREAPYQFCGSRSCSYQPGRQRYAVTSSRFETLLIVFKMRETIW
jgi:hypothetical protein